MKNRIFSSLVLVCATLLLGGCFATAAKLLPNGNHAIATTVGDTWDRSTTIVGEYKCQTDKETGNPIIGKCILADNAAAPDRVHGQTVAGQVAVGVLGGTGAAVVNGNTARSVSEKGKCPAGSVCNGTIINNQLQSVANALNENKVKIGVSAGAPVAACAATNSCGN